VLDIDLRGFSASAKERESGAEQRDQGDRRESLHARGA
jgi:hypothetical protein